VPRPHGHVFCYYMVLCMQIIAGKKMTKDVVLQFRKSLNDMYEEQISRYSEEMKDVLPPSTANIDGLVKALGREKAAEALANQDDPGRHHLTFKRLSDLQLERISRYGLFDDGPAPRKNAFDVCPQLHFIVTAGLTMLLRSDTVLSLRMTSFSVMPCPGHSGQEENMLLCFCYNEVSY